MEEGNLVLSWHNVSLHVQSANLKSSNVSGLLPWTRPNKPTHAILDKVSGYASSGNLLAIMGPSGSGKTSLLATISKRISDGIEGDILVNGRPVDRQTMLKISGYVAQNDLAVDMITVKEHMEFMVTLKMDKETSRVYRKQLAHTLLRDLGLWHCRETMLQNISGGERKRLSLAVQLIGDLPILFCDEPTTGLDSHSANTIITVLQRLASDGKAVVCTIHQPSSDIFVRFDRLCLLLPGGRLSYLGNRDNVEAYFESKGFQFPTSYNPADYILHILNTTPALDKPHEQISTVNSSPVKSKLFQEHDSMLYTTNRDSSDKMIQEEDKLHKLYSVKSATQITQLRLLSWRTAATTYRNTQKILMRTLLYIFTGFMISFPYIGLRLNQEGIQNIQGFHYIVITETIFCQAYGVMHTFPAEIPILLREMANGIYTPAPYYFSKVIVVLSRTILETFLFCAVVFWVAQVGGGTIGFVVFTAPVMASAVTSTAYGCFISTLFENISTASLLSVPVDLVSYTFSGLFLQLSTVPVYLKWVKYLSRFYYGIEAISILQWQTVTDIPCSQNTDIPCIRDGQGVLERYGFSESNLHFDFLAMLVVFCVLHLFGFLSLRRRSKQQSVY